MKRIYLDNNATTSLSTNVKRAMLEALELYGNASSMHTSGREAGAAVEQAREQVAKLIGANPDEIIFTASGSETNNMILNSFDSIITSSIEHPSVFEVAKKKKSIFLPVDKNGNLKIKEVKSTFEQTAHKNTLVSIMLANNETGVIQDIKKIAKLAKKTGFLVHTDATQAVGKTPVDVNELEVDYLTFSAHKIHGPKGVGALYVRSGAPIAPLILGGHQENNKRAGTINNLGIIGFGEAAKEAASLNMKKTKQLRDYLFEQIKSKIDHIVINTPLEDSLPNTLNISFLGAEGESILLALDAVGIEVSTGSACASTSIEPSHVLMALHNDAEIAHGSVRFSLGPDTTKKDIDYVIKNLPKAIERLRKISTINPKEVK